MDCIIIMYLFCHYRVPWLYHKHYKKNERKKNNKWNDCKDKSMDAFEIGLINILLLPIIRRKILTGLESISVIDSEIKLNDDPISIPGFR